MTSPSAVPAVLGIYRYPIKGLSPQSVREVELEAGKPFPFDRVFALVRPQLPFDVTAPRWSKKGLFLMLMLDETLARVQTHLDLESLRLTIFGPGPSFTDGDPPGAPLLSADLNTSDGRSAVEAFFRAQVPKWTAAPKLVHAGDGHFMDKPDNVMSCINLATVRSLEAEWGEVVHPLRFRANFYIDGAPPWQEFDWIGSELRLGDVLFRVDRRNGRCGATNVNPVTGERDLDIPGKLRKRFGHKDLGIYLVARSSGRVALGDRVILPQAPSLASPVAAQPLPEPSPSSYICGGCYLIYDNPSRPLAFSELDEDWPCPDCGTNKAQFRPYWPALSASPNRKG